MTRDERHRSLLRRHRDFRLLWCGETAGKFGASVTGVAMPLIAVSELHASTFRIGLLSAASWAPWLVMGLPAGVWVDRLPRRTVMLVAAAVSLVLFTAVPAAAWAGRLSTGLLLTVALLTGTAAVFFQTAYTAYLPDLLSPPTSPRATPSCTAAPPPPRSSASAPAACSPSSPAPPTACSPTPRPSWSRCSAWAGSGTAKPRPPAAGAAPTGRCGARSARACGWSPGTAGCAPSPSTAPPATWR